MTSPQVWYRGDIDFDDTQLNSLTTIMIRCINQAAGNVQCSAKLTPIVDEWRLALRIRQLQENINNLSSTTSKVTHTSPLTNFADFDRVLTKICSVLNQPKPDKSQIWSKTEKTNLLLGEVQIDDNETTTIIDNLPRFKPTQILDLLNGRILTETQTNQAQNEYQRQLKLMSIDQLKSLLESVKCDLDKIFEGFANLNAVYSKHTINSIGLIGLRAALFGPQSLLDFVIENAESQNCNRMKLATMFESLPSELIRTAIYQMSSKLIENLEESASFIDFVTVLKQLKICSLEQLIEQFWMPSLNVIAMHFDEHEWYFNGLDGFLYDEELPYSQYQTLANCLIDGLNALNCSRFNATSTSLRAIFQRLCLKITDTQGQLDPSGLEWSTTCSLPRAHLPPSLFNLCQTSEFIFSLNDENDINFPITAFVLALASGCKIDLDHALLDPDSASIESRIGLCNALAVALTQTLIWLDLDEVERLNSQLKLMTKKELIVFDNLTGYRAYFELLKKSTELVFDDEGTGSLFYLSLSLLISEIDEPIPSLSLDGYA